uniref:6-4 photolyase n=1 Tax=Tritonia tetraquetra TaxID=2780533 RepID=A0A2Z4QL48_9GAST|nr:6-4 photolyase [Tritonia tetraquetra]
MTQHRSIHWFRKGLRLHDNPAFIKACEQASEIYPIFILDPWFAKSANCRVGINRWRFLLQALRDLDNSLKTLNLRLFVVRGNPNTELENLCQRWKISRLTFEVDTEPYAVKRDEEVERQMGEMGIEVIKSLSHTLFEPQRVIKVNGGSAPLTYQRFQTIASKLGPPPKPLDAPTLESLLGCKTLISDNHEKEFGVPTLTELGKDPKSCGPLLYPGGEKEALERMERQLKKTNWICSFEKPQTSPNSLTPSTTVLSPYLKFGCLSSRLFYHQLADMYKGKKHSQPPVSLHGQLLWREFFYTVASVTPNFDKMEGNPVCRQIPWQSNPDHLEKWANGQTGFPFIDAIMRQLRQEGWIHHLARHAVACFLTRGDLWISWEEGMTVFEELLLDADWSLNAANWMWLSASAFFHQYFRVYSPIAFGKKTDPNGDYIRKYVPEVKKFPSKYIFEPWTAPLSMQQTAGCVLGKDYPKPLVDHSVASKANISKMAAAYNAAKKDKLNNASQNGMTAQNGKKRKQNKKDGLVQKKLKFT